MRMRVLPAAAALAAATALVFPHLPPSAAADTTEFPALCDAATEEFSTTADNSTLHDPTQAADSLQWLRSMMEPPHHQETGSSIQFSNNYSYSHTGEVTGSFSIADPSRYPRTSTTEISVTSPQVIPDNYRGQVSGRAPAGENRVVKAYLYTDDEYEQPTVTAAVVQPDGTWTIDLSPADPDLQGEWHFRLYDTATNEQIGQSWPRSPRYQGLEVRLFSITDQEYLTASQPASATDQFTFPASGEGIKLIQLVDTTHDLVIAEHYEARTAGLIRSNNHLPLQVGYGSRKYTSDTYDQALALMVAVGTDERKMADTLLNGLRTIQIGAGENRGAFPDNASQLLNPETNTPLTISSSYSTGRQAFILYALLRYQERYGDINGVGDMVGHGLTWIETQRTTTGTEAGLYKGGKAPDQVTWHSTEHNLDLWHVFERARRVLGDESYRQKADALAQAIMSRLWNAEERRFNQGWNANGPDTKNPLDVQSWGSIFLNAIGEYDKAQAALRQRRNFVVADDVVYVQDEKSVREVVWGYTAHTGEGTEPNLWFEGTFGVTQALLTAGRAAEARSSVQGAYPALRAFGYWPYSMRDDPDRDITSASSTTSTAWYLLTTSTPRAVWSECRAPQSYGS